MLVLKINLKNILKIKLTNIQYETLKVVVESRAKIDEEEGITIKLEDIKNI